MNEVWKKPPISLGAYQSMVGKEIGISSWHVVDQIRINAFADVIEDHQFIHVDPEGEEGDAVRFGGSSRFSHDVAPEHHVLRGHAGDLRHDDGRQLRL
jgi:hypothetical protein